MSMGAVYYAKVSLPFHVTSLCPAQSKDAILRKDVHAQGVDTLLVEDDKVLLLLRRVDGLVAHKVLEFHNFSAFCVRELSFRLD